MSNKQTNVDPGKEADALLLEQYVSASVVIDNHGEIVSFRGNTSPYLAPLSGQVSRSLFKMAQRGLVRGLRTTLSRAQKEGRAAKREGLRFQDGERMRTVTIEVIPLPAAPSADPACFFLVLFTEISPTSHGLLQKSAFPLFPEDEATEESGFPPGEQEYAASPIEIMCFIEELQAQNEELQVMEEDLRITNKELEASKEELQSANEELTSVNQELQVRNEQLQAAHAYTAALVETLWEPLLVLDEGLRVVQANRAFYQFFQTTAEATERHPLAELGNGQWNISVLRALLQRLSNQDLFHFEVDHTFPAIGHKKMLLNARRIPWGAHETSLILLAFEDVTDRELEKQRQQFLELVTHELKTPITSVKAYAEFLQFTFEQAGDVQSAHFLARMNDQMETLSDLVQALLDVTQIESGYFHVHRQWIDLRTVVRESVEAMQHTTTTHTIYLEQEGTGQSYADPLRIRQVLLNLLSNAIKYSPPNDHILVKLVTSAEGVVLSVQDFGRGIAPDQHHNVFERFFRIGGDAAETYPGLGLGLYIAAQIITQHDGRIWVESEEGKGALFSFFLPFGSGSSERQKQASLPPR